MELSRGKRWFTAAAVVVLVLLAALNWFTRKRVYRTVESTAAQLDTAQVKRGTSVPRVLAVLDSLHAIHSDLGKDGTIGALFGPSFESGLIHGDIHIEFQFDSTQRLVSRTIREVLTGP